MLTNQEKKLAQKIVFKSKNIFSKSKRFKNQGMDFKQLRDYVFGDDIRAIDWKSSARCQKTIVKEFIEDISININIIIDISESTKIGTDFSKEKLFKKIGYAISYAGITQKHKVTLGLYNGDLLVANIKSEAQLEKIISEDISLKQENLDDFIMKIKNSLLFLITDFYDENILEIKEKNIIALRVRDQTDLKLVLNSGYASDNESNINLSLDIPFWHEKKINNQIDIWWNKIDEDCARKNWKIVDLDQNNLISNLVKKINGL